MKFHAKRCGAIFTLACLLLAGCGGGSGGDSGGGNNEPPATGGITRTGITIAVGPITGFGSVIVNGISYETNASTTFTKDGQDAIQANFSLGQVVLIQGTIDDDNTNALATSVEFDDNVEGPVSSIDNATHTIVVLGQTVQVILTTSIDDSCPATWDALDGFLGVAAVEVSGSVPDDGTIEASRIECKNNVVGELEVTGVIAVGSLDTGVMTFRINALTVDYSGVSILQNFPDGVISEGDLVEAKDNDGGGLGGSGELVATSLEFKGDRFAKNEGDHMEVEGFITRIGTVPETDFDVGDITVTTIPGTTVWEGGDASNLNLNLKVEVEGEFNDADVLVATKVEIKQVTAVRVTGLVDSVDADTLAILGITITTEVGKTRFEDKAGEAPLDMFEIGDLNSAGGDYVEVRGQESPAGEIFALILERDDPRSETRLRGFVTDMVVAAPNLTVLGVTIQTTAGVTEFIDSRGSTEVEFENEDDFWAAVNEGSLIDVKGTETDPQILLAEEIELEME